MKHEIKMLTAVNDCNADQNYQHRDQDVALESHYRYLG